MRRHINRATRRGRRIGQEATDPATQVRAHVRLRGNSDRLDESVVNADIERRLVRPGPRGISVGQVEWYARAMPAEAVRRDPYRYALCIRPIARHAEIALMCEFAKTHQPVARHPVRRIV